MTSDDDVPGVVAPPPLIFLACLAAGVALYWWRPLPIGLGGVSSRLGPMLVAGGVALGGVAMREFRRAGTSPRPDRPSTAIIRRGPFRFSRNPAYLGLLAVFAGVGLWLDSVAILAMLVPLFLLIRLGVIAREERYLERTFGQEYLDYARSVRRWL